MSARRRRPVRKRRPRVEVRKSGEGPVTYKQSIYSRPFTQDLLNALHRELNIDKILFNDSKTTGRRYFKHHDNHLHVRVR